MIIRREIEIEREDDCYYVYVDFIVDFVYNNENAVEVTEINAVCPAYQDYVDNLDMENIEEEISRRCSYDDWFTDAKYANHPDY